ncbi:hypothetical protein ACFWY5_29620 [Nonomuraea sp. NPDC059007]|uniref:hypothetical protein n=1 Tax=Nonomuraea sp. NPDC059007 TaxID=3346692 RepID=UPI00367768E1
MDQVAAIFAMEGWQYAKKRAKNGELKGLYQPTIEDLSSVLAELIEAASTVENKYGFSRNGRFIVIRDPDLPDSYTLALELGYCWSEELADWDDDLEQLNGLFEREDDGDT